MATTITLDEAQGKLREVIEHLPQGGEVTITDGGKIVARLVGVVRPAKQRLEPGFAKGMITIVAEDDEHLKDFAEYMP